MRLGTIKRRTGPVALRLALAAVTSLAIAPLAHAQTQPAPATRYLGTVTAISGDTLTVKTDAGQVNTVEIPVHRATEADHAGTDRSEQSRGTRFRQHRRRRPCAGQPRSQCNRRNAAGARASSPSSRPMSPRNSRRKPRSGPGRAWPGEERRCRGRRHSSEYARRSGNKSSRREYHAGDGAQTLRAGIGALRSGAACADYAPFNPATSCGRAEQKALTELRSRPTELFQAASCSIAGTILSTDATASTVTVKDLATKKPVTVHITADAQLRRLDETMAAILAARLKGEPGGGSGGRSQTRR